MVALIASSVDLALPLESETQEVDPFSLIDPIPPLENATQVAILMSLSVNPILLLESRPDVAHIFLVDIESTMIGGFPPSPIEPPPINETILFIWGVLTGSCLPPHIPFMITIEDCGREVRQMLIDEGSSVIILSSLSWKDLCYPQLVSTTQTLFSFNRKPVTL
jgi:hypothetical protein